MTVVGDESIYALIPPPQHAPPKPSIYRSKFPGKLDRSTLVYPMGVSKRRGSYSTFGKPDGCNSQAPCDFTKARSGAPTLPDPAAPSHRKSKLRDATPSRKDKPKMNLTSGKDFVTANAVEAILSKPRPQAAPRPFTMKPDFGQVPHYLATNKDKVAREKAQVEEYLRAREAQSTTSNVGQLSQSERQDLLAHLKSKWSIVNTAYQKLSFTLDTPAKKKRKEVYEEQLASIEKDVQLLERGDVILIVDE